MRSILVLRSSVRVDRKSAELPQMHRVGTSPRPLSILPAAKIVDRESFFHLRESGGTKISSAYELCLAQIQTRYRPEDWNIYAFHYSDGDNWSARDTERCMTLLRDELIPRVNQFCYGQVKSAYGSGQFKKDLDESLADEDRLVTAAVNDRSDISEAIRAFLGKGR